MRHDELTARNDRGPKPWESSDASNVALCLLPVSETSACSFTRFFGTARMWALPPADEVPIGGQTHLHLPTCSRSELAYTREFAVELLWPDACILERKE